MNTDVERASESVRGPGGRSIVDPEVAALTASRLARRADVASCEARVILTSGRNDP